MASPKAARRSFPCCGEPPSPYFSCRDGTIPCGLPACLFGLLLFPCPQLWVLAVKGSSGRLSGQHGFVCHYAVPCERSTHQHRARKQLGRGQGEVSQVGLKVGPLWLYFIHLRASCILCWSPLLKLEPLCPELPLGNYHFLKIQRESCVLQGPRSWIRGKLSMVSGSCYNLSFQGILKPTGISSSFFRLCFCFALRLTGTAVPDVQEIVLCLCMHSYARL